MSSSSAHRLSLEYGTASRVDLVNTQASVHMSAEQGRGPVGVTGTAQNTALWRDVMMTLAAIYKSDLRYKGRDRTAYLAYLMKQGKTATAEVWEAQKQFLESAFSDEKEKPLQIPDPLLSVAPDEVSVEAFSRDESGYVRVAFHNDFFQNRTAAHGSAFLDLSDEYTSQLERIPSYWPTQIQMGQNKQTNLSVPSLHRTVEVPDSWLRGFLQVQSAAALPAVAECVLSPIDFYNVLTTLRLRKAKNPPRSMRFELIPNQKPRLVLEPWEIVLETHGAAFAGKTPRVVRTFGRQRLMLLSRLLPHLKRVRVQLMGAGLPVFWIFEMENVTLTVALSGWLESSWSSAASFDQLMPSAKSSEMAQSTHQLLLQKGPLSFDDLVLLSQGTAESVRAGLQLCCLRGQVIYDVAQQKYRPRNLFASPIDEKKIRYGSPKEALAHRLLGDETTATGKITLTKMHDIVGEGIELQGEIEDKEQQRKLNTRFTMDAEGRVKDAFCTCIHFRRSGMREGPCEHMIALRIVYGRERIRLESLRLTAKGRKLIRAETRTLTTRDEMGAETLFRLSFDAKSVRWQWGSPLHPLREQRVWFDSDEEAKDAYFEKMEQLSAQGYVDADAA